MNVTPRCKVYVISSVWSKHPPVVFAKGKRPSPDNVVEPHSTIHALQGKYVTNHTVPTHDNRHSRGGRCPIRGRETSTRGARDVSILLWQSPYLLYRPPPCRRVSRVGIFSTFWEERIYQWRLAVNQGREWIWHCEIIWEVSRVFVICLD